MNIENKSEILVIGGTGNIGTPLQMLLEESRANYRLLVRNEVKEQQLKQHGIPTIRGELGKWQGIDTILTSVDTVFLLSSPAPEMLELQKGLIDRAVASGVRKIVRLSAEPAGTGSEMGLYDLHGQLDLYLENSGLEYVILRPHYFMQNMVTMHAEFIKQSDMFAQYLGDAKIPMVDTRDIAKAAFHCLISDEFNNQTYDITGPRAISFSEVAQALSHSLQREIQYVPLSYEDQMAGFQAAGIPDWTTKTVMKLFQTWNEAEIREAKSDFETITHRPATDINQWADDFSNAFFQ